MLASPFAIAFRSMQLKPFEMSAQNITPFGVCSLAILAHTTNPGSGLFLVGEVLGKRSQVALFPQQSPHFSVTPPGGACRCQA